LHIALLCAIMEFQSYSCVGWERRQEQTERPDERGFGMRFLVTGGAGFLGSALANRLVAEGHSVRVVDDLSSGDSALLSPAVHFTRGDVNNIPLLWSVLQGVDCVYHLAARVSVAQSVLYPRDYNAVNVGGTVSQEEQPVKEGVTPEPDSPYAVSKWAAEQYVHTIGALWGIETVALRIFNAYGPRQALPVSHAPVVPRFLSQALTGGSVVIFGDGLQSRDFIYVSDVVSALARAAEAREVNRMVINVGSGQETTINQLAALVGQVTGHSLNVLYNEEKTGGVRRLVADIGRARELLGWEPQVSLAQGLAQTLAADSRFHAHDSPVTTLS
jgi:UDP-glucose 4-epimerase